MLLQLKGWMRVGWMPIDSQHEPEGTDGKRFDCKEDETIKTVKTKERKQAAPVIPVRFSFIQS